MVPFSVVTLGFLWAGAAKPRPGHHRPLGPKTSQAWEKGRAKKLWCSHVCARSSGTHDLKLLVLNQAEGREVFSLLGFRAWCQEPTCEQLLADWFAVLRSGTAWGTAPPSVCTRR